MQTSKPLVLNLFLTLNLTVIFTIFGSLIHHAPALAARRPHPLPQRYMERLHSKKTFIVFDWDENIFKLPTNSVLFPKGEFATNKNPRLFLISSNELSQFKTEVGQVGTPLEPFELIGDHIDSMNGSFRFARPGGERNYMLEDMKSVLIFNEELRSTIPAEAKAPFYELFLARETKVETRAADRILTGRGQTPQEFADAVSLLASVPEVHAKAFRAPEAERLTLTGGKGPAWKLKAIDLIERLREATLKGYTLLAFPDDDPVNIRRAAEALAFEPRTIDVWLIWTRENGDSRLIDLAKIKPDAPDFEATLKNYLDRALDPHVVASEVDAVHHQRERALLYCRALFF